MKGSPRYPCAVRTAREVLAAIWNHTSIRFVRAVVLDLSKFATILLSLEIVWWMLKRMELMGYPPDRLAYFEKVHFVSSLAAWGLLSLTFVVKLALGLYRDRNE